MKKMMMVLLAMALAMGLGLARAEASAFTLEGIVTEMREDGAFLLNTADFGDVLVKVSETTEWTQLKGIEAGAWVAVTFDGVMTRSIPPQITAQSVRWFRIDGVVLDEVAPEGAFLLDTFTLGKLVVHLPEGVAAPAPGTLWSVDYNGIVMLSYPGQIAARNLVALEALSGTVTASGEGFLTLDTPDGACRVALKPNARLPEAINVGDAVTVYMQKNRTAPADGSFVADVVIIEP